MSSTPPPGFGQGLVEGAAKGAYEMGKGLVDLAKTSASGWQQLGEMAKELASSEEARDSAMQAVKQLAAQAKQAAAGYADDPRKAIEDAKNGANALANAAQDKAQELWAEGKQAYADAAAKGEEARFIGQAIGRTAFEVGSLLIGAGEAAKAGELAKLSKAERAMGKVGSEVLPCGKLASKEGGAARLSKAASEVESIVTHGYTGHPLESDVGRKIVAQLKASQKDLSEEQAIARAQQILSSGKALPEIVPVKAGEKLYKLTPGSASPTTPYWATADEIEKLRGMSPTEIAKKLGLPPDSIPADGLPFNIQEIVAEKDGEVFRSVIAPLEKGDYKAAGGGVQTLVADRGLFSPPGPPQPFK